MEPRTKDRIAKVLGYLLGAVLGALAIFWMVYKIYNVVTLW